MSKQIQIWMILLLGILISMIGCQSPNQNRITLGGSFISPSFRTPNSAQHYELGNGHDLLSETARPRSQWEPTQYIAPFDGVAHQPHFIVSKPLKKRDLPRRYGKFPTVNDVLDNQSTSWMSNLMISIDELGRSFIGTPYIISIRLAHLNPTEPLISPYLTWKRSNYSSWSSGHPSEAKFEPIPLEDKQHDDTQ